MQFNQQEKEFIMEKALKTTKKQDCWGHLFWNYHPEG